jgi:hypothetical protein
MNKYGLMFVLIAFLIIVTITVQSVGYTTTTDVVNGITVDGDATILGVFGFLATFFRILTFQIPELPVIINLIFIPITMMVVYMIVDVLKDIVPFT